MNNAIYRKITKASRNYIKVTMRSLNLFNSRVEKTRRFVFLFLKDKELFSYMFETFNRRHLGKLNFKVTFICYCTYTVSQYTIRNYYPIGFAYKRIITVFTSTD